MATATITRKSGSTEPQKWDDHWAEVGNFDPGFHDAIRARLNQFNCLDENWDHEGAVAINPKIIGAARRFANALSGVGQRPHVSPLANGSIQFEWHGPATILVLEFVDPNTMRYVMLDDARGIEEEGAFAANDVDQAEYFIRQFSGRKS